MKNSSFVVLILLTFIFGACVPLKKYNDLLVKAKSCDEELALIKDKSIDFESKTNELEVAYTKTQKEIFKLIADTSEIGENFRSLKRQYQKMVEQNIMYEKLIEQDRTIVAKSAGSMQADMDAKSIELQRKQEVLKELEEELKRKQLLLVDREKRVSELEEMMQRKDEAVKQLKKKVYDALLGYKNKGLTVQEKNGKIYVSLDAKLLFKTASTAVEPEGQKALIDLTKVLENEKELEIIVEGHTDNDKMLKTGHPKNNWELSVLRATSVVEIMLTNPNVSPTILMAAGRSEYHPVDELDKGKNRRIEIIISPNLNPLFELISK
jgi:chemotaxis protein MotB